MITLGHNSSAVFYDGTQKPIGYEEERLNGIKSSSAFPQKSIEEIIRNVEAAKLQGAKIFVSHWFDTFEPRYFPGKYYDYDYMHLLMNRYDMKLVLLSREFTHHDAHAYSSLAFLENRTNAGVEIETNTHFVVADGFGNEKEVISVYKLSEQKPGELDLVSRIHGYERSLGLLYQYATSFCGMKETQDEYKFLGYESKIEENVSLEGIQLLKHESYRITDYIWTSMGGATPKTEATKHLDSAALLGVKLSYHNEFAKIIERLKEIEVVEQPTSGFIRSSIGFVIQSCVENIMSKVISAYDIENVVLSGGCFYNVKLNNHVLTRVKGQVCVLPLAGDQGAAIGMYRKYIGAFDFSDLCFGKRKLSKKVNINFTSPVKFVDSEEEFIQTVVELIDKNHIVNVMHGDMEFGPRALCNTSTLALPTAKNVAYINHINRRNTVMPMAPVILNKYVECVFDKSENVSRVLASNEYMVMTHDICEDVSLSEKYQGIIHKYPLEARYSGRPQIVRDRSTIIGKILDKANSMCLINTSFNTHGTPILFSVYDAVWDFTKQRALDYERLAHLVILTND